MAFTVLSHLQALSRYFPGCWRSAIISNHGQHTLLCMNHPQGEWNKPLKVPPAPIFQPFSLCKAYSLLFFFFFSWQLLWPRLRMCSMNCVEEVWAGWKDKVAEMILKILKDACFPNYLNSSDFVYIERGIIFLFLKNKLCLGKKISALSWEKWNTAHCQNNCYARIWFQQTL